MQLDVENHVPDTHIARTTAHLVGATARPKSRCFDAFLHARCGYHGARLSRLVFCSPSISSFKHRPSVATQVARRVAEALKE